MEVGWAGVSQKDIYFFKRRLEDHPISQGGYKILGESNREKGLATGVAGEGLWGSECVQVGFSWAWEWCKQKQAMRLQLGREGLGRGEEREEGLLSQLLAEEMVAHPMWSLSGQVTGHIHIPIEARGPNNCQGTRHCQLLLPFTT